MSIQYDIERFFDYMTENLDLIFSIKTNGNDFSIRKIKKILCLSILDALSIVAYKDLKKHNKRFKKLLMNFSEWENHNFASIFILKRVFDKTKIDTPDSIKQYINDLYTKFDDNKYRWSNGYDIRIGDVDVEYISLIKNLQSKGLGGNILCQMKITQIKHINIFYENRNALIHEYRDKLGGWEGTTNNNDPCYVTFDDDESKDKWNILYPIGFYANLCETTCKNMKQYCIKNSINPFRNFSWGDFVYDGLN